MTEERPKPAILVVIDGLTPTMLEATATPALRFLLEHGDYRRATSTFPSLTPVCLASIATGAGPDVHGIPHLVWWNREEQRLVEYGSSFGALRAAGLVQGVRDSVVNLNERHLSRRAETVYEALEDAGWTTAAINITTYRGRHRHLSAIPGFPPVYGPKRLFFYSVYESDRTGAPIAFLNRSLGSIDSYAAAVGRWLVSRDGFDLLVYYLPDYDYASHALGPDAAHEALARADAAVEALMEAAGGREAFLERYVVLLCSDHGQAPVERAARLEVAGGLVTASNRAAMIYGDDARALAAALDHEPSVDLTLFLDGHAVVARRGGDEDLALLDAYPRGRERAEAALRNPNAGEVLVSAARGWEFVDLAGRHHVGGGSHGALDERDSLVPMLSVGLGEPPGSITEIKAVIAAHFGVAVARGGLNVVAAVPGWVDAQLSRRGIVDARVLAAMARVPRERFVPPELAAEAYADRSLPIGYGQTMSQPFIVAFTCQGLRLRGGERVLDVGTGSGYAAAVLAELAGHVDSIERIPALAAHARATLAETGYHAVAVHEGDGALGLPGAAPFDAIAVAAASRGVPPALWAQLVEGGRLAIPLGARRGAQRLCVLVRGPSGPRLLTALPARFVPLVSRQRW